MKLKFLFCFLFFAKFITAQVTWYEDHFAVASAPYEEGIAWWQQFAKTNANVTIETFGETDAGYPLHIITLNEKGTGITKNTLLINNAIHPGEPDGVDASMLLFRDLSTKPEYNRIRENCKIVCIPYYNIGGALNRNNASRANQDGPTEYGFRGNAQNLDLNRDFIKCDSKNALSFVKLLHKIKPDIYVETHVSNGADYQYTMTYLATQPDKLGNMGQYLRSTIIPFLEGSMKTKKQEMVPYINIHSGALEDRMETFYDMPRYSTGLTTLHHTYGFITETHMLKPFQQRVKATYEFLLSMSEFLALNNNYDFKNSISVSKKLDSVAKRYPIDWNLDSSTYKTIDFKGYEHRYKKSNVTGQDRLFYDREKPIIKKVKYFDAMKATKYAKKPKYYILKKGFWAVEERLLANGVPLIPLTKDTIITVNSYKIIDYETAKKPYEKHYIHSNTSYQLENAKYQFRKGDYLIPMNTDKNRFIVEVLEPDAPDSYFNWNFFDAVLQQKEWYSDYVFIDKAEQLLIDNEKLKTEFLAKKKDDKDFAANAQAQLYWLYQHSPHYEKEHMHLPIFRIE